MFKDTSVSLVTTMIDYYALPNDFPGFNERPAMDCYKRIEFMGKKFGEDINNERFVPYLQLHEFEALIFASAENFGSVFIDETRHIQKVNQINNKFNSPEEINENPESAPSKQLKRIYPGYIKPLHGSLILSNSNLDDLRNKCPHFSNWLSRLES